MGWEVCGALGVGVHSAAPGRGGVRPRKPYGRHLHRDLFRRRCPPTPRTRTTTQEKGQPWALATICRAAGTCTATFSDDVAHGRRVPGQQLRKGGTPGPWQPFAVRPAPAPRPFPTTLPTDAGYQDTTQEKGQPQVPATVSRAAGTCTATFSDDVAHQRRVPGQQLRKSGTPRALAAVSGTAGTCIAAFSDDVAHQRRGRLVQDLLADVEHSAPRYAGRRPLERTQRPCLQKVSNPALPSLHRGCFPRSHVLQLR